jgi:hypothetical protein
MGGLCRERSGRSKLVLLLELELPGWKWEEGDEGDVIWACLARKVLRTCGGAWVLAYNGQRSLLGPCELLQLQLLTEWIS